jgi:hypothetical protein
MGKVKNQMRGNSESVSMRLTFSAKFPFPLNMLDLRNALMPAMLKMTESPKI